MEHVVKTLNINGTKGRHPSQPTRGAAHEPLIAQWKIDALWNAVRTINGASEAERLEHKALVDALLAETVELELVLDHSTAFLLGDTEAGRRLHALMNYLVKREGLDAGTAPATEATRVDSPSTRRRGARAKSHVQCFLAPEGLADIVGALLRLAHGLDRFGDTAPVYLTAIDVLVEKANGLELLFAAAENVREASDTRSRTVFERTLELLNASRRTGASSSLARPKIPNPIPGLIDDPCALLRSEARDRVTLSVNRILADVRYRIDAIENLGRIGQSRIGCAGDRIAIVGQNFGHLTGVGGAPLGEVVFPRLLTAIVSSWSDERIECTVPDDTRTGEIVLNIPSDVPGGLFHHDHRLADPESDGSFEIVFPVSISLWKRPLLKGRLEACHPFTVRVRVNFATSARLEFPRGTVVWSANQFPVNEDVELTMTRREPPSVGVSDQCVLFAENMCSSDERSLTISAVTSLDVSIDTGNTGFFVDCPDEGATFEVTVRTSCPTPDRKTDPPREVALTVDHPEVIAIPGSVLIAQGSDRVTVEGTATSVGIATVAAHRTAGHRDSQQVEVVVLPAHGADFGLAWLDATMTVWTQDQVFETLQFIERFMLRDDRTRVTGSARSFSLRPRGGDGPGITVQIPPHLNIEGFEAFDGPLGEDGSLRFDQRHWTIEGDTIVRVQGLIELSTEFHEADGGRGVAGVRYIPRTYEVALTGIVASSAWSLRSATVHIRGRLVPDP